jgi:hypothetical protein
MKEKEPSIGVLELRNYLLKPGKTDEFIVYFNRHFVNPMHELKGYTLGQFTLTGTPDRFVWMRGFENMDTRLKFLGDFYIDSPVWKEHGPGANAMMINSDNVYLLRPLLRDTTIKEKNTLSADTFKNGDAVVVVDFYLCNSTIEKTIALFNTAWIPWLETIGITSMTMWVAEMEENKFHRLPAFQDKNLLLTITRYKTNTEYQEKLLQLNALPQQLKLSMLDLVTVHTGWVLSTAGT